MYLRIYFTVSYRKIKIAKKNNFNNCKISKPHTLRNKRGPTNNFEFVKVSKYPFPKTGGGGGG
jgi:hypothetical protein